MIHFLPCVNFVFNSYFLLGENESFLKSLMENELLI